MSPGDRLSKVLNRVTEQPHAGAFCVRIAGLAGPLRVLGGVKVSLRVGHQAEHAAGRVG